MEIVVRKIKHGSPEYELTLQLRYRVLREPLGLYFSPEDFSRDATDFLLGAFSGERLLGCLILSPREPKTIRMRQVAVESETQGQGIGRKLVEFSEAQARQMGFSELHLHARDTAVPFYLRLGYEVYGEPFKEVTIPHRKMRKRLT